MDFSFLLQLLFCLKFSFCAMLWALTYKDYSVNIETAYIEIMSSDVCCGIRSHQIQICVLGHTNLFVYRQAKGVLNFATDIVLYFPIRFGSHVSFLFMLHPITRPQFLPIFDNLNRTLSNRSSFGYFFFQFLNAVLVGTWI